MKVKHGVLTRCRNLHESEFPDHDRSRFCRSSILYNFWSSWRFFTESALKSILQGWVFASMDVTIFTIVRLARKKNWELNYKWSKESIIFYIKIGNWTKDNFNRTCYIFQISSNNIDQHCHTDLKNDNSHKKFKPF